MAGFETASARRQADITSEQVQCWVNPDGEEWGSCFKDNAGYTLRFHDLADFVVDCTGEQIIGFPTEHVDPATIEHLFLNHVAPLVSGLRGNPVFHGCAIDLGGHAAVFLGKSGSGKSTLALGFARMGYKFLTDDGIKMLQSDRGWLVEPGHPSIRLWDDSFESQGTIGTNQISHTLINSKKRLEAGETLPHSSQATPITASYFLSNRDVKDIEIIPVSGTDAAIAWVQNSFMLDPTDPEIVSRHFAHVSQIASKSPSFRIDYPRRFDALQDVCRVLVEHIEGIECDN